MSTYQVGKQPESNDQAIATWLFVSGGEIPAEGHYSASAYDGASGTLTVYHPDATSMDVVWHDVALSTVFDVPNLSAEGWVRCTY